MFTIRDLSRTSLVAATIGLAALTLSGPATALPASPTVTVKNISEVCPQTGQRCPNTPSVGVTTRGESLKVEFQASGEHCSDIVAQIMLDGKEWGEARLAPGERDGGYEIPVTAGDHTIGVRAVGIEGKCNTGTLGGWKGTLRIERLV